jgi:hypothetical protein
MNVLVEDRGSGVQRLNAEKSVYSDSSVLEGSVQHLYTISLLLPKSKCPSVKLSRFTNIKYPAANRSICQHTSLLQQLYDFITDSIYDTQQVIIIVY